jgi:hypothetical protein
MKSQRKEFRYGDFTIPVKFRTAYEEGSALLVNISTGGCALRNVCPVMNPMEVFLLTIDTDDLKNPIEAKAVVLRIKGETLAAHFTLIPSASQKLLRRYFANKLRNQ